MVHIVKKKIGNNEYLYLQKSFHIKGKGQKKKSKHIAYLGKAGKYSPKQISNILKKSNNSTKQELNKLLKKYDAQYKKILKRRAGK